MQSKKQKTVVSGGDEGEVSHLGGSNIDTQVAVDDNDPEIVPEQPSVAKVKKPERFKLRSYVYIIISIFALNCLHFQFFSSGQSITNCSQVKSQASR
jgi:hypothetical protein